MRKFRPKEETPLAGLREERAALVHRYTVDPRENGGSEEQELHAPPAEPEPRRSTPRGPTPTDFLIEVYLVRGFLWRWSLFELIELGGDGMRPPIPSRSLDPVARADRPHLSQRAAIRAAEGAARALCSPATERDRGPGPPGA